MRTTITFHDSVYRALRVHAAQTGTTISELVENAVKYQLLEDLEDIAEAEARKNEPTIPLNELIKEFKTEGLL